MRCRHCMTPWCSWLPGPSMPTKVNRRFSETLLTETYRAAHRHATLLRHGAGEAHVLTEFYSSRTLRSLVLSSADGAAVPFVELLWARVFKDRCQQFVGKQCNLTAAMYQAMQCNNVGTVSVRYNLRLQATMQRRCLRPY